MTEYAKRISQKITKLPQEQVDRLIESITEENDTLCSIIESLNTGLLICDSEWNLIQTNKAAGKLLPLKSRDSDNWYENPEPVWKLINDSDIGDFIHNISVRQEVYGGAEFTLESSGGTQKIIQIDIQPLMQEKRFAGIIIKAYDITEKRNQEVLFHRMENLARLTNLAASVAHEIKNPLGSISIHIQLVQKAIESARKKDNKMPDEKFVEKHLDIVNEEIERLNKTIVDFLFAVRPVSATLESMNVNNLLSEYADFISPELEKAGMTLTLELADKIPNVLIDTKLLKQAIINLAQNAIAAMKKGDSLTLKTLINGDKLEISIEDTGSGMDEETAARVFEPYFTTKTSGTGLGLTLVYKIIQEFNGSIDVKSILGEGTCFTISLPIPQKEKHLITD